MSSPAVRRYRSWLARLALSLLSLLVALGLIELSLSLGQPLQRSARLPDLSAVHGPVILCIGDSVTYGLDLDADEAWPAQLDRLGLTVPAYNLGLPGAQVRSLTGFVTAHGPMTKLPADARPWVVLQLGHNDFNPVTVAPPPRLALARFVIWLRYASEPLSSPPMPARPPPYMRDAVRHLRAWAEARGGGLFVSGYPVPGAWQGWDPISQGRYVNHVRPRVEAGNHHLRDIAETEGVPFLDAHSAGHFPEVYDPALFLDSIHLTAEGSLRMAALAADALRPRLSSTSAGALSAGGQGE